MTKPSFKIAAGEIKILFAHIASFQMKLNKKEGQKKKYIYGIYIYGMKLERKREGKKKKKDRLNGYKMGNYRLRTV